MTDVTIHVDRHPTEPRYVYRCGWTPNGIAWDPQGCEHRTPREAGEHADQLKGIRRPIDWAEEPVE